MANERLGTSLLPLNEAGDGGAGAAAELVGFHAHVLEHLNEEIA